MSIKKSIKSYSFLFLAMLSLALVSCKNEPKKDKDSTETQEEKEIVQDFLTITIRAKVTQDDIFELYFAEDVTAPYSADYRIGAQVKGQEGFQDIEFVLPERAYPFKFRFDLGLNGHSSAVDVESILFSSGAKNMLIPREELSQYFTPNPYLEAVSDGIYARMNIEDKYDPFITSSDFTDIVISLFSE